MASLRPIYPQRRSSCPMPTRHTYTFGLAITLCLTPCKTKSTALPASAAPWSSFEMPRMISKKGTARGSRHQILTTLPAGSASADSIAAETVVKPVRQHHDEQHLETVPLQRRSCERSISIYFVDCQLTRTSRPCAGSRTHGGLLP